jgi:hypothetical protein
VKLLIDENYNSERISTHCVWYAALSERIFLTKVMKKVIVMVLDMPIVLTKHFLIQNSQRDQVEGYIVLCTEQVQVDNSQKVPFVRT